MKTCNIPVKDVFSSEIWDLDRKGDRKGLNILSRMADALIALPDVRRVTKRALEVRLRGKPGDHTMILPKDLKTALYVMKEFDGLLPVKFLQAGKNKRPAPSGRQDVSDGDDEDEADATEHGDHSPKKKQKTTETRAKQKNAIFQVIAENEKVSARAGQTPQSSRTEAKDADNAKQRKPSQASKNGPDEGTDRRPSRATRVKKDDQDKAGETAPSEVVDGGPC